MMPVQFEKSGPNLKPVAYCDAPGCSKFAPYGFGSRLARPSTRRMRVWLAATTAQNIIQGAKHDGQRRVCERAVEITPAQNGGYIVRRRAGPHEYNPASAALAFSNWRDLMDFLQADYYAANKSPEAPTVNEIMGKYNDYFPLSKDRAGQ